MDLGIRPSRARSIQRCASVGLLTGLLWANSANADPLKAEAKTDSAKTQPADAESTKAEHGAGPGAKSTDPSARQLSSYEQESLEIALKRSESKLEPNPTGKRVEAIDVVSLEVFEDRDDFLPYLPLLNVFHSVTGHHYIEREVLVRPGQTYDPDLVAESERILRNFIQLSVVLIVPTRGSKPDSVRLLVITKDIWSLRVNWAPTFYDGKLAGLVLEPSEWNVAGTTQRMSATVSFSPIEYWVGAGYYIPRIGDSRILAAAAASLGFDCQSNDLSGASGTFTYGKPLYSTQSKWSWYTAAQWSNSLIRPVSAIGRPICSNPGIRNYAPTLEVRPYDEEAGEAQARILELPYRYREDRLRGQLLLTRSFFKVSKLNLSFGLEADARSFDTVEASAGEVRGHWEVWRPIPDASGKSPSGVNCATTPALCQRVDTIPFATDADDVKRANGDFQAFGLPPHDRRIGPYVQLHAYRATFLQTLNYDTLGLQEDVQVGHDVYLRVYPGLRPLASRNMLGVFASAAYTWPIGDGFFRALLATTVEVATRGNDNGPSIDRKDNAYVPAGQPYKYGTYVLSGPQQSDAQVQAELHLATPSLGVGRFVSNVQLLSRPIQYLNRYPFILGGTDQLRGYQAAAFFGSDRFVANTEFRTRPVKILSVLAGLDAFWDAGDAGYDVAKFHLKHGLGAGLRILFPQLDRQVFRIDVGVPLQPEDHGKLTWFAGFTRAFGIPYAAPPSLLPQ
jgi:hypothetical protein